MKPTPRERLIQRCTLGWTLAEQALADELGYEAYLERQLDYESIDVGPLEDALHEALPSLAMTPFELIRSYGDNPALPAFELVVATLFRSIYSPRQLFERMAIFWSDHFNIDLLSSFASFLKPADDRDVVRRHALGSFPELLEASAQSPAMLVYLTNDSNVKGHPNENYARELMELHTLGAEGGFSQDDVKEVSRAFTGWTVKGRGFGPDLGQFLFHAADHDDGPKAVLGRFLPAGGGIEDGETVLDVLASHPATAEFVSTKLLRYMWGYDPPRGMVDRVADTYVATGGDVREMLRTILRPAWMRIAPDKLKRPYHFAVSAVRALGAELLEPANLVDWLYAAGHLPFGWAAPDGYPDSESFWSGFLLPRWNYSIDVLDAVDLDAPGLDPSTNPSLSRGRLLGRLDRQLMAGRTSGATKTSVRAYLEARPFDAESVRDAIGLSLSSPEFQYY